MPEEDQLPHTANPDGWTLNASDRRLLRSYAIAADDDPPLKGD